MGPFMESSLPLLRMHWDLEPTPIPSQYLFSEMGTPQCGARAVPVRRACAGRGAVEKGDVFRPDNPLRTGTVRGPMQRDVPTGLNRYPSQEGNGQDADECLLPSWEGSSALWSVPLLGGVRGGFVGDRFMESQLGRIRKEFSPPCIPPCCIKN